MIKLPNISEIRERAHFYLILLRFWLDLPKIGPLPGFRISDHIYIGCFRRRASSSGLISNFAIFKKHVQVLLKFFPVMLKEKMTNTLTISNISSALPVEIFNPHARSCVQKNRLIFRTCVYIRILTLHLNDAFMIRLATAEFHENSFIKIRRRGFRQL